MENMATTALRGGEEETWKQFKKSSTRARKENDEARVSPAIRKKASLKSGTTPALELVAALVASGVYFPHRG